MPKGLVLVYLTESRLLDHPPGFTRRNNPVGGEVDGDEDVIDDDAGIIGEEFGFNTFTQRRDITNNDASVVIDLPDFFKKIDFEIHYNNRDVSFQRKRNETNERNDDTFGGIVIMQPTPKIKIRNRF